MFTRGALSVRDGIYSFLEHRDDYIDNYEQIAADDNKSHLMSDDVKEVLLNCCELFVTGGCVVDVGCAYGHIINRIRADQTVGVDISMQYLHRASPDVVRVWANAEDVPLQSGIADFVICTDVFEHVQDEKALAAGLIRLICPGGMLLLAVPWEQDLSVYETDEYIKKYRKYKYVHLRSVNDAVIRDNFGSLTRIASTVITIGMRHMTIKPYPIRFFAFRKEVPFGETR